MTPSCWHARAAATRRAFGELVRRHQQAALRLAAVIGGSTEEAKDIVQDAFVKVHANLDSYRGSGSVRSWMLRVVANDAKNHVRSRVRRMRRDDRHARLSVSVGGGSRCRRERHWEHEALVAALQRLSRDDRDVLGSRFVAELSEAETAEVLGIALGTVKSRTSRALGRLQHEFELVSVGGGRAVSDLDDYGDLVDRLGRLGDALDLDDTGITEHVLAGIRVGTSTSTPRPAGSWRRRSSWRCWPAWWSRPSSRRAVARWFGLDGLTVEVDPDTSRAAGVGHLRRAGTRRDGGGGGARDAASSCRPCDGELTEQLIVKTVGSSDQIEEVTVDGHPGLWFARRHPIT